MKKIFLFSLSLAFLLSCSKEKIEEQENSSSITPKARYSTAAVANIKGANWACPGDNYQSGYLALSGLGPGDSYNTNKAFAQNIASQLSSKVGANTVRIPCNIVTVNDQANWARYRGVIDGILANGSKVIIAYWHETTANGYVTDWNGFKNMWTGVCDNYQGNPNVYFEIMNEPYGYSTNDLLNMYKTWLADHPGVTRGRVLCGGTGYDDNVKNIGGDSRISGCLYSQHIYGYWSSGDLSYWYNNLLNRIGSANYSKTVITEAGCTMNSGLNFFGTTSSNNEVNYFQGVCNASRDKGMAICYWPGVRDGDSYAMCTRSGSTLNQTNSSGKNELNWGYGN